MNDLPLHEAEFDPTVKRYWLTTWALVSGVTIVGLPLLVLTLPLAYLIINTVLANMSATLSQRKLIVKKGVLFKVEKSIPLEKITDVALRQGPLMRFFGIKALSFETAGQSGEGALVSLTGIENAEDFREAILQQKDKVAEQARSTATTATGPSSEQSLEKLTASVERIEALLMSWRDTERNKHDNP